MKKLLSIICAAIVISSSAAAGEVAPVLKAHNAEASKLLNRRQMAHAPASRSSEAKAIIDTPAGKLSDNMSMSEFALYPRGFEIYQRQVSGKVSAIVEGEDGCLYVKNPIGVYTTDSWLRLEHREGSLYVAKLPQPATEQWDYEGESVCMNFDRLYFDEDEGYYFPSFSESELSFNYENGVLTSVGEIGEDEDMPVMLGLTYDIYGPDEADEAWAWFGVNNIIVRPVDATPLQLPEGIEPTKMVMASSAGETAVTVAVNGDDIYLQPAADLGYALGKINDGKAVFDSYQYVGISDNSHCYFVGGESKFIEDEDYFDGGYTTYSPTDGISFSYLSDDAVLKSDGAVIINEGDQSFYAKTIFDKPVINNYQTVEAAPANPEIIRYSEYDDFDEYGVVVFDLPTVAADGSTISKIDLYYNIFTKDSSDPYVFRPGMYELINSPMTNIPYDFSDGGYDFSVKGTRHTVVIYEDLGSIGVQSVNASGEKLYKSDIVWTDGSVSGIESVAADHDGESVLFDLSGRKVTDPAPGLYIRRQGSQCEKVVIR